MNIPPNIQSQHAKWMEVILIWLGICIPIKFGPVVYQSWQYSDSTPELLINNLVALLILATSLGLLLKHTPLSSWILMASPSHSETSRRDSELSGWLTIGIFTCGFLVLVHTLQRMLTLLGSTLSLWFHPHERPSESMKRPLGFLSLYIASTLYLN